MFGLHSKADISKNLGQSEEVLSALLAATQGGGGGAASTSGAGGQVVVAATVKELIEQLPADFDVESVQLTYPVSYSQSMNQVGGEGAALGGWGGHEPGGGGAATEPWVPRAIL